MGYGRSFFLLGIFALSLLCSCNVADENNSNGKSKNFSYGFYCKMNGKDFYALDSLAYAKSDSIAFTIRAINMSSNGTLDDITITVESPLAAGEYSLSKDTKPGSLKYRTNGNGNNTQSEYYISNLGKLIISKIDADRIEGTLVASTDFSKNNGDMNSVNFTDGKFNLKIKNNQ